jgi:hypothetical protein
MPLVRGSLIKHSTAQHSWGGGLPRARASSCRCYSPLPYLARFRIAQIGGGRGHAQSGRGNTEFAGQFKTKTQIWPQAAFQPVLRVLGDQGGPLEVPMGIAFGLSG